MASDNSTQALIDAEIAHHYREIVRLKRCRNAATPIALLPTELLGIIFCECSLLEKLDLKESGQGVSLPACFRLGRVSSAWRAIALGCPKLWSVIQVRIGTPAPLVECMYAHSEGALLSLDLCDLTVSRIPGEPKALDTVARLIQEGAHRFESLAFRTESWPLQRIFKNFRGEFVSLQRLEIEGHNYGIGGWQALNIISHTPQLRNLIVAHPFIIPTSSPLLLNCHKLVDIEVSLRLQPTSNASDALSFLRSAHHIKRLFLNRLDRAQPGLALDSRVVQDPLGSVIYLPSLEHLFLGSELRHFTALEALRVPNARVHLVESMSLSTNDVELQDSLNQLPRTLKIHGILLPRQMRVSFRAVEVWEERVSHQEEWGDTRRESGLALHTCLQQQKPSIIFPYPASDNSIFSLENWSFSSLTTVTIMSMVSSGFWVSLASLGSLEVLKVLLGADQFIKAIRECTMAAPFPSLKVLECCVETGRRSSRSMNMMNIASIFQISIDTVKERLLAEELESSWRFALDIGNLLVGRGQQSMPALNMIEFLGSKCSIQPSALTIFSSVTAEVKWRADREVHIRF